MSPPGRSISVLNGSSSGWIDTESGEDAEARIFLELHPHEEQCHDHAVQMEIRDRSGHIIDTVTVQHPIPSGGEPVTWDGRVDGQLVSRANNPYSITFALNDGAAAPARSDPFPVWVGRPVLLVHGVYSSAEIIGGTRLCREISQKYHTVVIEYVAGKENARGTIEAYADMLEDTIEQVLEETGAKRIDIIGHSMGGLISRWYMQTRGTDTVGKLIMIGTPNHGSDVSKLEGRGAGSAILQMQPHSPFLRRLNGNDACDCCPAPDGCGGTTSARYSVIMSREWPTLTHVHVRLLGRKVTLPFFSFGDGIVPYRSATLSNVPTWNVKTPRILSWRFFFPHSRILWSEETVRVVDMLLSWPDSTYRQHGRETG